MFNADYTVATFKQLCILIFLHSQREAENNAKTLHRNKLSQRRRNAGRIKHRPGLCCS